MSAVVESHRRLRVGVVLVVVGVVVLALVLLAPLVGWLAGLLGGHANFDVLMPFELFPATIGGMVLITVGSVLARRGRGWVVGAVAASVLLTVAGAVWAAASGIANESDVANTDWRVVVAMALFAAAYVAFAAVGAAGAGVVVSVARDGRRVT
jgi:hypothetical protein